jgi:hypothetical protein
MIGGAIGQSSLCEAGGKLQARPASAAKKLRSLANREGNAENYL